MSRATGALTASLGGVGTLVAVLLIVLKKGPIAGSVIILAMALVLFVVSILSALANWKKEKGRKP